MNHTLTSSMAPWMTAIVIAPVVILAVASVTTARGRSVVGAWRTARVASGWVAAAAFAAVTARVVEGQRAGGLVRLDTVTAAALVLISLVGWVVIRYSRNYLSGDPHERRYVQRVLATLAAVTVVVTTNHLAVLLVAWCATSLFLHRLLTFFGDRPVAVAVAHKKFLLARVADACMIGSAIAFATAFGTLRIDAIGARAASLATLPVGARVGVLLVALAAVVKCAQLPFHGWLIQVMEAPTPVSALLHAGVVNLGGFVLLRFAPVVDRAVETRSLLVIVGASTAVVAALVMTTRVSVKVALAWSTCAQMGFMLMQCGLGLWEMALLHLLAHSAYKAHAFLGAGGTVRRTRRMQLSSQRHTPAPSSLVLGTAAALAATASIGVAWERLPLTAEITPTVWLMLGIVALAVVPLATGSGGRRAWLVARAAAVQVTYLLLHEVSGRLVPHGGEAPALLLVFTGAAFVTLFAVQSACTLAADSWLVRRIRPWIYAGLFLDDAFTRIAFAVSPPPRPVARAAALPIPTVATIMPTGRALEVTT